MKSKDKKHPKTPQTGDDFISLAERRGAVVTGSHSGFRKIRTPRGSMHIAPGQKQLDPPTLRNIKKWFKLLGLMILAIGFITYNLWWPMLRNALWIMQNSQEEMYEQEYRRTPRLVCKSFNYG